MKKLLTSISILTLFAINANAQVQREVKPRTHASHTKGEKHKMMKDLNLSKEQKGKMKEFKQSMKQKKDAIKNNASLSEEQKKQQMKQLHKEQKQNLQTILTPEQKAKLKKERMEMKKSGGDKDKKNG